MRHLFLAATAAAALMTPGLVTAQEFSITAGATLASR